MSEKLYSYQLRKKNSSNYSRKHFTFRISRFFGDPFALTTLSLCIVSFVVALVGSITAATDNEGFPKFTWWGLAYQFLMMVSIFFLYCFDLVDYYKNFLTAALGVAFVYNTNSTTILIYADGSRKAAASAGCIMLSIVNLIWMFYFGSDNGSPLNRKIDSYSLNGMKMSNLMSEYAQDRRYSSLNRNSRSNIYRNSYADYSQRHTSFQAPPAQQQQQQQQQELQHLQHSQASAYQDQQQQQQQQQNQPFAHNNYMSSTALNGFENIDSSNQTTPQLGNTLNRLQNDTLTTSHNEGTGTTNITGNSNTTGNTGITVNSGTPGNTVTTGAMATTENTGNNTPSTNNTRFVNPATARADKSKSSITDSTAPESMGLYSDMAEELSQFPYKAKALYSYEADPSDAYEISFSEGEILSVADIEGRWWSCRKENGERGIIPSNYVELIE
ncbi:hypothetical protein ACO0RG_004418 [Hanseniaspora osmophila]|uniref:High osmolarity signaling protein SHO1 n=1 Tax=Hanseniaspora osmophila TaxID=56408 RepID=A0A1E5RBS2_9ASCO|nr:High osmolarity signaling protein SHO1 [Hanseniaspora osmophila]